MGMSLSSTERDRIIKGPDFEECVRAWPALRQALESARQRANVLNGPELAAVETEIHQLHEAVLCIYLRPRHATRERYVELIERIKSTSGRSDLFSYKGVSFEDALIEVCVSHNLDVGALAEVRGPYDDRFPRALAVAGEQLNTQFCAAVLRLVDVLDFDRERTPRILFESLGIASRTLPGAEISLREWQKHMAVHSIEMKEDEIVVHADSSHPAIEASIKQFCGYIERELRDTSAVIKRNSPDVLERYRLDVPITVRSNVRSQGYVYKDFSFRLNQTAVMKLLMGEKLYAHPGAAVRELIQNAVDACLLRRQMERAGPYEPKISVRLLRGTDNSAWIEVSDNGIGMDEHVLGEYFFQIGSSYYDSPEVCRITPGAQGSVFTPISRFGIGIMSVFMLGDTLEVTTKNNLSLRGDTKCRRAVIESMKSLAFVTEHGTGCQGTTIKLRLKPEVASNLEDFSNQIEQYLRRVVVRPPTAIDFELVSSKFSLVPNSFFKIKDGIKEELESIGLEVVVLELGRWSEQVSGIAILFLSKNSDGQLSHLESGQYIRFGLGRLNPKDLFDNYLGNRLTVNGFAMSLKKLTRTLAGKASKFSRLAMAYDIEIRGKQEVVYNVARDKVTGAGAQYVKSEIQKAFISGLKELGVFSRMTLQTKGVVEGQASEGNWKLIEDRKLLDLVKGEIPGGTWPKNMYKVISEKLQIDAFHVKSAIQTLLKNGEVTRTYGDTTASSVVN
jgi:hypothetical protein